MCYKSILGLIFYFFKIFFEVYYIVQCILQGRLLFELLVLRGLHTSMKIIFVQNLISEIHASCIWPFFFHECV